MIVIEKWMILTPLQKLPNNVGDLGKIIVATGFEWLPKVQKIAQSGHTAQSKEPFVWIPYPMALCWRFWIKGKEEWAIKKQIAHSH